MANGAHHDGIGGDLCDQLFAAIKKRLPDVDRSRLASKCTFHSSRGMQGSVTVEHTAEQITVRPFGDKELVRQVFDRRGITTGRENPWLNYELGGIGNTANIEAVAEATLEILGDALPGPMSIIANELDRLSTGYAVGSLRKNRKDRKNPSSRWNIFDRQTIFDSYAYHYGGRTELQFNIGIEGEQLRHGVAFSFEPSRNFPWSEMEKVLLPKVKWFNAFLRLCPNHFPDMSMWYDDDDERLGPDEEARPIPWERARRDVFVFLGKRQPLDRLNYELILSDFDRLLPLYLYIERSGSSPVPLPEDSLRGFRPGCSEKMLSTVSTPAQRQLDIDLRHNELQKELHRLLVQQYGYENVGTEFVGCPGTRVDVVVRQGEELCYYEIKTAGSARACLREAVGQLLEYSHWPGSQPPRRLIVAGEAPIDEDGQEYLRRLHDRYSLKIEYQQVTIE